MTLKKQAMPTEALLTFEVFYNGELFQTVEFSSLRKCNNWREKNLETPFLYVIKTPDCNRESCIELSKRYFFLGDAFRLQKATQVSRGRVVQ